MKKIKNPALFQAIVTSHRLQSYFSSPLSDIAELYTFKKGDYVYQQNAHSDTLFLLISGRIEVFSFMGNDRTHCQQYFFSCEILGEADILWGEPAISYVLTLEDCCCIGISLTQHRDILLKDPVFLSYVAKTLASRLKDKTTEHNRLLKLENRLASYILLRQHNCKLEICLKETAELLDSSYRHLLRVISTFCESGYLEKTGRGEYYISNMDAIKKLTF